MDVQSLVTDYIRREPRPLKHVNSFKIAPIKSLYVTKQFSKNTSPHCDETFFIGL